jgi:putative transposase
METKRTRHAVYSITYHLVWCPKYRRQVLVGPVGKRLEELIQDKVTELNGEVVALEVQPDHVHLFAGFPPTWAIHQVMHHIKGATSYSLRREFPFLKSRLPSLWTRSYYVGTAGNVSAETIRRYIEAQKGQ